VLYSSLVPNCSSCGYLEIGNLEIEIGSSSSSVIEAIYLSISSSNTSKYFRLDIIAFTIRD